MVPILITLLCLVTRFIFAGEYLEGWDDVDFALALHDYDLAAFQPHFPGYFLYIAMGRLVLQVTNNNVAALVLPNIIFGSLTVIPLYYLTADLYSKKVSILVTMLYIVNPLCWLQAERPMPDTTGLFFIILSIQLMYFSLTRVKNKIRYMSAGSFVLGIALGIKLTYFPFIFSWFFILYLLIRESGLTPNSKTSNNKTYRKVILLSVCSFVTGICFWLLPLISVAGIDGFLTGGFKFVNGHFTDWGGSIGTQSNLLIRIRDLYWCIFVNGLGFWWIDAHFMRLVSSLIIVAVIAVYLYYVSSKINFNRKWFTWKMDYRKHIFLFTALVLPYLTWIFTGQNLSHPRHALPLIPVFLILISAAIIKSNLHFLSKSAITVILLVSSGIVSTNLILKHKNVPSTQLQLVNYVKENFNANSTRIYCGESKRMFEYYVPGWDARRVGNIADLKYDMQSSPVTPELVLCTSEIKDIKSGNKNLNYLMKLKQDRYIDNVYGTLVLYSYE